MVLLYGVGIACARADMTNPPATFNEVYGLVRTHLQGMTEAELDQAAIKGLLTALAPRVLLSTLSGPAATNATLISQAQVFEENVAYIRISRVADGLGEALSDAQRALTRTGKVVGLVLDLRFATGENYAAALDTAGLFLKSGRTLLDLGAGPVKVEPAAKPISLPVAVLISRSTTGAAEVLAASLREAGAGLLLGTTTGGFAAVHEEFILKSGQRLLIATKPVKLADGTELSPKGVRPDIEVPVSREDEQAYFADPYRELARLPKLTTAGEASASQPGGTNRVARRQRTTEADLVRARREGSPLDGDAVVAREPETPRPVLRDPVLARAVDLLKGLAVVRRSES